MNTGDWSIVYKKAISDDGTLLFPERLTQDFLERARKTMGSYLFANQYQNEIIPDDEQTFKKSWIKYYSEIPERVTRVGFIDPAISKADSADYTGIVVVAGDCERNWYVQHAVRLRLNPTQIIEAAFSLCERFGLRILGIEDVAFQQALIHFSHEEMKRRGKTIPITGIKRGPERSKESRILGLVPRLEFGTCFFNRGLHDLELELAEFPRGAHDDILDALSSIDDIMSYPPNLRSNPNVQPSPNDPRYESWYISQLRKRNQAGEA